ncbi:hypothetical protein BHM03_00027602 [Ensete ventricosum]|nr:hypothetical protein BHM03_00027602 [Ensete ventricosum]
MHPLRFPTVVLELRQRGGAANPHAGPPTHGQAATKTPHKGVAGCGQGQHVREASGARKGRQSPVGAAPTGRSVAHGHSRLQRGARKGGRLQDARKGLLPAGVAASVAGVAAPWQGRLPVGKGSRRLRRGNDGNGSDVGVEGVRGLGHPFEKRMILPL